MRIFTFIIFGIVSWTSVGLSQSRDNESISLSRRVIVASIQADLSNAIAYKSGINLSSSIRPLCVYLGKAQGKMELLLGDTRQTRRLRTNIQRTCNEDRLIPYDLAEELSDIINELEL